MRASAQRPCFGPGPQSSKHIFVPVHLDGTSGLLPSDPVLPQGHSHQRIFSYLSPGSSRVVLVCSLQRLVHHSAGFRRGAISQFCAVNLACLQYASGWHIRTSAQRPWFAPGPQSSKLICLPVPRIIPGFFGVHAGRGLVHHLAGGAITQFRAVNLACLQHASGWHIRASAQRPCFGPVPQSSKHNFVPVPRILLDRFCMHAARPFARSGWFWAGCHGSVLCSEPCLFAICIRIANQG